MRAALCFSGHCRNFSQCYEVIHKHIITPLEEEGYIVDIFVSTWDSLGHRLGGNFDAVQKGEIHIQNLIDLMKPKTILIERFDQKQYLRRYPSDQWKAQPHLRNANTAGDAISMWFRIYNSWMLMDQYRKLHDTEYDVVFRMRPDIVYDTTLNMIDVRNLQSNTVYMAKWHGQYPEVTLEMMDHFAFGDATTMDHYMTLALFASKYFDEQTVHTGEGFLYTHLRHTNIQRIDLCYSVQREDRIEEVTTRPG